MLKNSIFSIPPGGHRCIYLAVFMAGLCWAPWASAGYRSMVVTVTAYNSVPRQTEGRPDLGAWSDELHPGMHAVAVSRDLIREGLTHGTTVAIEGFKKNFTVLDKMAAGITHTVDIYMGDNVHKARQFGRKRLRIWWYEKSN